MDAREYLFYGLGQVAYAVALSDGKIQKSEEKKLHQIVQEGVDKHDLDYNVTEIIFKIVEDEKLDDADLLYKWGIENIELGSHKLDASLKLAFTNILTAVAEAFDSISSEEQSYLNRFNKDIALIGSKL